MIQSKEKAILESSWQKATERTTNMVCLLIRLKMQVKRIYKHDRSVCPIVWIRETPAYTDAALLLDAFLNKQTSTDNIMGTVLHQDNA